jgi:hypothetical protein
MNKILVWGMGFVFLGSQAVSAAPIKRYGSPPPTDIIINADPQSLPSPPSPQSPSSPSPQASNTRFNCEYFNGEPTVMYRPDNQPGRSYPWAVPRTLGDGWTAERRCQEISQRLEMYRPDGLEELRTGYENNYQTICVTTQQIPSCRIVLTIPPGQSAEMVRDRVFESIAIADSGQMTQGVNAYTGGQNNNFINQLGQLLGGKTPNQVQKNPKNTNGINLRPFLAQSDGGTGEKLKKSVSKSSSPKSSHRFNTDKFR